MQFDIARVIENANHVRPSLLWKKNRLFALGVAIIAALIICWGIISPPRSFPANTLTTIPADASAAGFAHQLKDAHIIRSEDVFRILARISGFDGHLDSGAYVFQKPVSLLTVLWRIGHSEHGIEPVRITITEGMTRYDIASTFEKELPGFDAKAFLSESSTSEGYLFPETYFFMPGDSSSDVIERLTTEFNDQVASITPQINASKHSEADIVILASILEREAKTEHDKQIIAGILWNRMAHGMPLQVDAAFGYAHQENGYTPTAADLDSDSLYNTYRRKGLPPTPISNPGIESLLAAANPINTKYVYYLTGTDGEMHYAVTFDEHKKNKALYLK